MSTAGVARRYRRKGAKRYKRYINRYSAEWGVPNGWKQMGRGRGGIGCLWGYQVDRAVGLGMCNYSSQKEIRVWGARDVGAGMRAMDNGSQGRKICADGRWREAWYSTSDESGGASTRRGSSDSMNSRNKCIRKRRRSPEEFGARPPGRVFSFVSWWRADGGVCIFRGLKKYQTHAKKPADRDDRGSVRIIGYRPTMRGDGEGGHPYRRGSVCGGGWVGVLGNFRLVPRANAPGEGYQ